MTSYTLATCPEGNTCADMPRRAPGYDLHALVARVLKIFFHDACFDGTTSAALFAAFYRDVIDRDVEVRPSAWSTATAIRSRASRSTPTTTRASTSGSAPIRRCGGGSITTRPRSSRPRCARCSSASTCRPGSSIRDAPSCAGLIARDARRRLELEAAAAPRRGGRVGRQDRRGAVRLRRGRGRARACPRSGSPRGSRTAARRSTPRATSSGYRTTRSPRSRRAPRSRRSSPRSRPSARRELEAIKPLGVWHGDVIVFDRFDDLGARSPGFLGYWLFPTCAVRRRRHAHRGDDQDLASASTRGRPRPRKPDDESASCARATAAAATRSSAASRSAPTSSPRARHDRRDRRRADKALIQTVGTTRVLVIVFDDDITGDDRELRVTSASRSALLRLPAGEPRGGPSIARPRIHEAVPRPRTESYVGAFKPCLSTSSSDRCLANTNSTPIAPRHSPDQPKRGNYTSGVFPDHRLPIPLKTNSDGEPPLLPMQPIPPLKHAHVTTLPTHSRRSTASWNTPNQGSVHAPIPLKPCPYPSPPPPTLIPSPL